MATPDQFHMRRAALQLLESLQRSGIEQLPRAVLGPPLPIVSTSSAGEADRTAADGTATARPAPTGAATALVSGVATNPDPPRSVPVADSPPALPLRLDSELPMAARAKPSTAAPTKLTLTAKKERLAALCEDVKSCRLCPALVANRTQTVFGVGNPNTRLCFFGEAPGADEDRQGEPFVGRAGQLLDRIIEACTLKRRDVYILNTVKCRPPDNRNPEADEVEHCRPFFEQQLELIRPEYICCLGLVSAKALLATNLSVGKLRGQLHPWRWAKVLVTYHPAYLLRNPDAKKEVWKDMKFLMGEMGIEL